MNKLLVEYKGKSLFEKIEWIQHLVFYLWSFTVFYKQFNFIGYLFVLISLFKFIYFKEINNYSFSKSKTPYLLLLLYIIWNLFSLIYSANLYEGIKRFEKFVPLLLISILGIIGTYTINFERSLRYYLLGLIIAILISLLSINYKFDEYLGAVSLVKGFSEVNMLDLFEHNLYISIMFLMPLPYIFELVLNKKRTYIQVLAIFLLISILYFIFSSGTKITLFLFVIIMMVLITSHLRTKLKTLYIVAGFSIFSILVTILILNHARINKTIYQVLNNKSIEKIDNRIVIWNNSIDIIKENIYLGVGIGDSNDELMHSFILNNNIVELENKFNVHNQYLQSFMDTGLPGVIILVLFLLTIIKFGDFKLNYKLTFVLIYLFCFSVESVLSRNLGTFPFSFFTFLFLSTRSLKKDLKLLNKKSVFYLIPVLIFLFSLLIYRNEFIEFDKTNPKTYMTAPFNYLEFDELPRNDQLPQETDGCSFEKIKDFRNFETGKFLAPEIFIFKEDREVYLNYGIWCYLSKDSNINEALIYAWDGINSSHYKKYNLNQKGEWQYLALEDIEFKKGFSMGVRMDILKKYDKITGKIIFAFPKYKINLIEE